MRSTPAQTRKYQVRLKNFAWDERTSLFMARIIVTEKKVL